MSFPHSYPVFTTAFHFKAAIRQKKLTFNKHRPILHSPTENPQPCCLSEGDYFCDYLSKTEHFSREKEMMEQYYHEKIAFLILFDNIEAG